jgi:hypothetical protein
VLAPIWLLRADKRPPADLSNIGEATGPRCRGSYAAVASDPYVCGAPARSAVSCRRCPYNMRPLERLAVNAANSAARTRAPTFALRWRVPREDRCGLYRGTGGTDTCVAARKAASPQVLPQVSLVCSSVDRIDWVRRASNARGEPTEEFREPIHDERGFRGTGGACPRHAQAILGRCEPACARPRTGRKSGKARMHALRAAALRNHCLSHDCPQRLPFTAPVRESVDQAATAVHVRLAPSRRFQSAGAWRASTSRMQRLVPDHMFCARPACLAPASCRKLKPPRRVTLGVSLLRQKPT